MGRLKSVFTKPFPWSLEALPGGRWFIVAFYVLGAAWLNYVWVYSLATGKMRGRYATGWVEGRESAPVLYWLYIFGLGGAVLFLDGYVIYKLTRLRNVSR